MYNNERMEEIVEELRAIQEEWKRGRLMIGWNWNAWIGEKGDWIEIERRRGGGNRRRNTKHRKINEKGRRLIEMVEKEGWRILNGNIEDDREEEFTFMGEMGSSVIDYVIIEEKSGGLVKSMKIEVREDSDHFPLVVEIDSSNSIVIREKQK